MKITTTEEIPDAPRYAIGWDLSLSGWGPFASVDDPDNLISYVGETIWKVPDMERCPVIYTVPEGTDLQLLLFNCNRCDVYISAQSFSGHTNTIERGRAKQPIPDDWSEKFKREHSVYNHSIVYSFFAMWSLQQFDATGLHNYVEWIIGRRKQPFITVRMPETTSRWYTEPGLGWTFHDDNEQPYRYCHPDEYPKKGDYAVQRDRHGRSEVKLQTYTYYGRNRRYKVTLETSA